MTFIRDRKRRALDKATKPQDLTGMNKMKDCFLLSGGVAEGRKNTEGREKDERTKE